MSKDLPLHVLLGDTADGAGVAEWLESLGLSVVHINDLEGLAAVLRDNTPASLIVDLTGDDESMECIAGLDDVMRDVRPPLVIVMSGRADQDIRLRAVEAGVDVFLPKPVQPRLLLQYLRRPRGGSENDCRIFLAGDSPELLSGTVSELEQRGMAVKRLKHSSQLLLSVINFSPDLLLISDPLAGHAGDAVGHMVHQLSDYEDLPIIYVRTGDAAAVNDAIEAAPVASIRADEDDLEEVMQAMAIDPELRAGFDRLESAGWEVIVVSNGCGWYIDRLLGRADVRAPVYSNPGWFDPDKISPLREMVRGVPHACPSGQIDDGCLGLPIVNPNPTILLSSKLRVRSKKAYGCGRKKMRA